MDRKLNLLKELVAEYSKQHTEFETLDFEKNYKAKVYADFYNSKNPFSRSIAFFGFAIVIFCFAFALGLCFKSFRLNQVEPPKENL